MKNKLEIALLDPSGIQIDFYLEEAKTADIMRDIEEIRLKAALSTPAGALREKIQAVLNDEMNRSETI